MSGPLPHVSTLVGGPPADGGQFFSVKSPLAVFPASTVIGFDPAVSLPSCHTASVYDPAGTSLIV